MNSPTLLVMAAGLGSRFGGKKQIEPVGINDEIILDYSLDSAVCAGFRKFIFIIKKDDRVLFEQAVKKNIPPSLLNELVIEFVYQSTDILPKSFTQNIKREKPWGTGHAVLCAKDAIKSPFMVINADDYYGDEAFIKMFNFLLYSIGKKGLMISYSLKNTVLSSGSVSRGVCDISNDKKLIGIAERTKVYKKNDYYAFYEENQEYAIDENTPVSMNCFGFTNLFFENINDYFLNFLENSKNIETDEFYLPTIVENLIKNEGFDIYVENSNDKWYGITYKQDSKIVCDALKNIEIYKKFK